MRPRARMEVQGDRLWIYRFGTATKEQGDALPTQPEGEDGGAADRGGSGTRPRCDEGAPAVRRGGRSRPRRWRDGERA